MRRYARRMPTYADPLRAGRHPFQTYLLALACVASVPPLVGRPTSGAVGEALPYWVAIVWSATLVVGCGLALLGAHWPVDDKMDAHAYVTGLFLERLGLALVWPAALVCAGIIAVYARWDGIFAAAIVSGFGWAARRRMRDVGKVFGRAIAS